MNPQVISESVENPMSVRVYPQMCDLDFYLYKYNLHS